MKLILTDHMLCYAVIFLQCSSSVLSLHSTAALDDVIAQASNPASPAKKYRKKLRKEEGAIRLVGGSNDYEGEWLCGVVENYFKKIPRRSLNGVKNFFIETLECLIFV